MREYEKIKSIVYGKLIDKTDDRDYTELSKELFDKELASDECRKRMYGMRTVIEAIEKDNINVSESDVLADIEAKKEELIKESMKLQTAKIEYNRNLRKDSRFE